MDHTALSDNPPSLITAIEDVRLVLVSLAASPLIVWVLISIVLLFVARKAL